MKYAVKVARRVRMTVNVVSSERRLPVRGFRFDEFSERERKPLVSSMSPIVVLPSSDEFREDTG